MTVIGTNIASLRAANASSAASKALSTSMERLSTGKRINSAKDDAAGLAIASRMTSAVKSMTVAVRNANDGISMAQTAEGALGEVTNMLQRMKELATQSANGTLGTSERQALQAETDQLTSQINDISKTTNFNGINLLDGSVDGLKLQTGINAGDTVSISMASVSTDDLGLTSGNSSTVNTGRVTGGTLTSDLVVNGVTVAATGATSITDAKSLAAAVNAKSSQTGVVATASNSYTSAAAITGPTASFQINSKDVPAATDAADLVAKINADSDSYGVTASLGEDGKVTLSNSTGSDIVTTGSTFGSTKEGYVSFSSTSGAKFTVSGGAGGGLALNDYNGVGYTGTAVTGTALSSAGIKINGVDIADVPSTASETNDVFMGKVVTAINAKQTTTGVTASYDTATDKLTLASNNGGGVIVEGASEVGIADQGTTAIKGKVDITSQQSASNAMKVIDKALDQISSTRGNLGAIQNRLEVTVNNLTTTSTNLADARSRIEDADFSVETANLAKAQILSSASTAMLAQANQSQQSVLQLLR